MSLEIEIKPDGKRIVVTKILDGKPVDQDRIDPTVKKQRLAVARLVGVSEQRLMEMLTVGAGRHVVVPTETNDEGFTIRGILEKRDQGTPTNYEAVFGKGRGLDNIPTDQILDWSSLEKVCCLDVDYHETTAPARRLLQSIIYCKLVPRPFCWHFSKSGGLHLFYVAADPFTAEELAATAALRYRTIDPAAGLELKKQVRGPGPEIVNWTLTQDTTGGLSLWLGGDVSDTEAATEYMRANGLEPGRRYDHDRCPVNPSDDGGKHRQPVCVSEQGIYCFMCEGKGRVFGSRKPGFFPWSAILDTPGQSDVSAMIKNLTHWGHAQWVLTEKYGLPHHLARIAYRAALKVAHADTPKAALVPMVFNEHTDELVRIDDGWRTVDGYTYPKDIIPLLGCLPGTNYVTETGDVKGRASAVCLFQQATDLSRFGYPSLEIVHGFRLSSVYLPPGRSTVVARPHPDLLKAGDKYLPRYVAKTKRMAEEKSWAVLEQVFPKIDRRFIRYSIAAMACAQETRLGMLPITFTSGPSGAGKSATPRVAAAILGAGMAGIVHQNDDTRYRASVKQGKQRACGLLFDEVLKEAQRSQGKNFTFRSALDFFLTLTADTYSHTLHVGPERMGRLPACFLSEPAPPNGLRDEMQLARRMRHHRLEIYKHEWAEKWAAAGVNGDELHKLRTVSVEMADACNAILSEIVDEFFTTPLTFDAIADKLQVYTVLNSPDFDDPAPFLLDFFRLVCDAPELTNEREKKMYSRGHKKISKTDEDTDLVSVYSMFADGPPGTPEWLNSRKLLERDWSALLKSDYPVRCEIKTNGVSVYVRFAVGPMKNPVRVNGEINNAARDVTVQ